MRIAKQNNLILLFLFGSAVFNIMDYFLTRIAISRGFEEWNPLINAILHSPLLPILKLLIIPSVLCFIWLIKDLVGQRLLYYSGVLFSTYFLLMIYFGLYVLK